MKIRFLQNFTSLLNQREVRDCVQRIHMQLLSRCAAPEIRKTINVKPSCNIKYDEKLGRSRARWRIKVRNPVDREIICGRTKRYEKRQEMRATGERKSKLN